MAPHANKHECSFIPVSLMRHINFRTFGPDIIMPPRNKNDTEYVPIICRFTKYSLKRMNRIITIFGPAAIFAYSCGCPAATWVQRLFISNICFNLLCRAMSVIFADVDMGRGKSTLYRCASCWPSKLPITVLVSRWSKSAVKRTMGKSAVNYR